MQNIGRRVVSPRTQYLSWRGSAAIGCKFARLLAKKPGQFGQRFVRVPKLRTAPQVAKKIASIVDGLVADEAVSVAALFLPGLTTLEHTAEVMIALDNEPQWGVAARLLPLQAAGDFIALRVVRDIPFEMETRPSEALVFGNFPEFPPTRRAPVTVLEVFVGKPRPWGPLDDAPIDKVNLAHIELNLPTHGHFERMWKTSKTGRAASLEDPEDARAKAKVTLVVPPAMARHLGCHP